MDIEDRAYEWCEANGITNPPRAWITWLVDRADWTGWQGLDYSDFQAFCFDQEVEAAVERAS